MYPDIPSRSVTPHVEFLADDEVECCKCERVCTTAVEVDGETFLCPTCQANEDSENACPFCGELGGTPITVHSSEYQGDSPHGGMVEWSDEACSLCKGRVGSVEDPYPPVIVPLVDELEGCPF